MTGEFIVHEDKSIIVVHKPAGVAVQTRNIREKDIESRLLSYLSLKSGGKRPELYVVHRLDQPVEGLVVFARTKKAAAFLTEQLGDGRMTKLYHAVVEGVIPKEKDTLVDYLLRDPKTNTSRVVDKGTAKARRSELSYRKTGDNELEIKLKTGRHHQIRVQLSHAGMPISGDIKYGASSGSAAIGLKAVSLGFIHPDTGKRVIYDLRTDKGDCQVENSKSV